LRKNSCMAWREEGVGACAVNRSPGPKPLAAAVATTARCDGSPMSRRSSGHRSSGAAPWEPKRPFSKPKELPRQKRLPPTRSAQKGGQPTERGSARARFEGSGFWFLWQQLGRGFLPVRVRRRTFRHTNTGAAAASCGRKRCCPDKMTCRPHPLSTLGPADRENYVKASWSRADPSPSRVGWGGD